MTNRPGESSPLVYARTAGVLYLVIIACGIFGEAFVRSTLIVPEDAAATAANLVASEGLFRAGFLADSIMCLCDVALAVMLYILLKPVNAAIALVAMCFRLTQTAVLALNLLHFYAAVLLLNRGIYISEFDPGQRASLSYLLLDIHGHGYDLGLLFFGAHCVLLGYLIAKSGYLPKILGILVIAASGAYLVGSFTRFLFPEYVSDVAPIYIVAVVSEVSLCLWLLVKGVDIQQWQKRVGHRAAA